MKNKFRKYSIFGGLCLFGLFLDPGWLQYVIFTVGGIICALGWILTMEAYAQQTLENKGIKNEADLQAWKARTFPEGNVLKKLAYKFSIFGAVMGLFGFFFDDHRIRYPLLALFAICFFAAWLLERDWK